MRKRYVIANWKMNKSHDEATKLINEILNKKAIHQLSEDKQVVIATPFIYLQEAVNQTLSTSYFSVAAQNCHQEIHGAYTGEISATQLNSIGVTHVIIGHSERRKYFLETDNVVLQKVQQALAYGLTPIICCGESLEQREDGSYQDFIQSQLENSVFQLDIKDFSKIIIAYEPIWAIGTGKTASAEQAQEVHALIRKSIHKRYDSSTANKTSILYGGSCNAKNAGILFSQKDVDGGLIGGASLVADEFAEIISTLINL
ncbi:MAG: triose-phosphate isomerase [Chitinophagales bacterium]|nr:triose-phosphate isomerase [Chitinophagales bacterium]